MDEFRLNAHGKFYTIEESVENCRERGGEMMFLNYDQVLTFVVYFYANYLLTVP